MFTGEKLRQLRLTRQMKQTQIAYKLNITQQRYSALENSDKLPDDWYPRILHVLNYTKEEADRLLDVLAVHKEGSR